MASWGYDCSRIYRTSSIAYVSCTIVFANEAFSIAASMILFPLIIDVVQMMICFRAA
jgi:hypothetical protein